MLCASLLVEKYPSACLLYLIIIFSFISLIMHLHDIKTFFSSELGYYFIFTVKPEFSLTIFYTARYKYKNELKCHPSQGEYTATSPQWCMMVRKGHRLIVVATY